MTHYNANQVREEVRVNFIKVRRKFSSEMVAILEKSIFKFKKSTTDLLMHANVLSIVTGALEPFPTLELPEELSPLIDLYRNDLLHDDLYRAFPRPNEAINMLNSFTKKLTEYQNKLFTLIQGHTGAIFFRNRDVAAVSMRLLELNKFHTEATLANPYKIESALNQAKLTVYEQQRLLDASFEVLHMGIETLLNTHKQLNQPLMSWNRTLINMITQRNNIFLPALNFVKKRIYSNNNPIRESSLTHENELQKLCSDSSVLLSAVEKELERLFSENGGRNFKTQLNVASDSLLRPLHLAIQMRRDDIVSLLLDYGATIKQEDLNAIALNTNDHISQHIAALLHFHHYMQTFGLKEEIDAGRILALINKAIGKLSHLIGNNKDCILVLGGSGDGKSTIVNIALGVEYEGAMAGNGLVVKKGFYEKTPTGRSFSSTTFFPEFFEFMNTLLGDMAGVGDTHGHAHETAAGIIIQLLSQVFKNIRLIVLVCETPTFHRRGKEMNDIFNMYGRIIGESTHRMDNVLILINEEVGGKKRSVEEIISLFNEAAEKSSDLEDEAMFFMKHLTSKNILVVDPLSTSFRPAFETVVAQAKSTPFSEFNFNSFHQHVEGFKKLLCHLEHYVESHIDDRNSMLAAIAMKQLANITSIRSALEPKAFLPKVNYDKTMLLLQTEEHHQLNRQLMQQIHWRNQTINELMIPMMTAITLHYANLTINRVGSLQEIEQFSLRVQVAQTFLKQMQSIGLIRLSDCPAILSSLKDQKQAKDEINPESSTNSFGIPGAGIVGQEIRTTFMG